MLYVDSWSYVRHTKPRRIRMVSILKFVAVLSCGILLCLGLSKTALAADGMRAAPPERQGGQAGVRGELDRLKGGNVIQGTVLNVERENYYIRDQKGKEVRLHVDETTE